MCVPKLHHGMVHHGPFFAFFDIQRKSICFIQFLTLTSLFIIQIKFFFFSDLIKTVCNNSAKAKFKKSDKIHGKSFMETIINSDQ